MTTQDYTAIDPATRLGLVCLTVSDLGRSLAVYSELVGSALLQRGCGTAVLAAGEAPLLALVEYRGAAPWTRDYTRLPLHVGASWTTDAPFRETAAMIETCRQWTCSHDRGSPANLMILVVKAQSLGVAAWFRTQRWWSVTQFHRKCGRAMTGDVFGKQRFRSWKDSLHPVLVAASSS